MSVEDYRRGVLENKERRALRLWIRADLLFERDEKGVERLSEDGRTRLDSAMSQFVRYPRTSPLVVEGYAQQPTADQRFLLSRTRAELVRDYIIGRFGLDPKVIGGRCRWGPRRSTARRATRWDGVGAGDFRAGSGTPRGLSGPAAVVRRLIGTRAGGAA